MENVFLRPLDPEDAPLLLKWMTDPQVLEWYEGRDQVFTPERVQEDFFEEEPGMRRWAVLYHGRPVGYAQTYPLDEEGLKEYGLPPSEKNVFAMDQFIGEPDCWGKHIGRSFVSLLVSYLTEQEEAGAVVLDPHVSNPRAVRCYEACGFRKIKILPAHEWHEGRKEDCFLMKYHKS